VLITPALNALAAAASGRPNVRVQFALAGEQGLSMFAYPASWAAIIDRARARVAKAPPSPSTPAPLKYEFGVALNYDKVCGCVEPEEPDALRYNATYAERFKRWSSSKGNKVAGPEAVDVPGVKRLLQRADFVGMSAYAPIPGGAPGPNALEVSAQTAAFEFGYFGISLRELWSVGGKPLIYSESGLGGCQGSRPAPSLDFLRAHPFLGVWPSNGYAPGDDPWRVAAYRDYRRAYYKALTAWAVKGGGPQYRIDGIYVSSPSWK
jgi:hypothetical protein